MPDSIIKTKQYVGEHSGPKLIVLGAIHGNESCGPKAIELISEGIESGAIAIAKGSVTFAPISNPEGYAHQKRFIEQDLNRVFKKTENPSSYEARLANDLSALVDESDVLLDVHSTSAPGPTCVFIDFPTENNVRLAHAVGAEYALLHWPELYASNEFFDSYDTTRYAFEAGKDGIIIETGQHEEPEAVMRAYLMIVRVMRHLGIIKEADVEEQLPEMHRIRMVRLERKEAIDDTFTASWKHLERLPAGTCVATRADGTQITVETDSVMLLPKHHAVPGDEWFYIGVAT